MRVLCTGGWGYGNFGDELILEGTLAGLKTALPDANVTFTSFNPEQTRLWHKVNAIPSLHRLYVGKNSKYLNKAGISRAWISFFLLKYAKNPRLRQIAQETCSNYDLVIQAGGGYFNDLFWTAFPGFAFELLGALDSNSKVALVGQTIGPFRKYARMTVSRILQQIQFIYVRDEGSIQLLAELGVHHAKLCADSALLVDTSDFYKNKSEDACVVVFMQQWRPYVDRSGKQTNGISRKQLIDTLAGLLSEATNATSAEILITTSVAGDANWTMCKELAQQLTNRHGHADVRTLKPTSPQEIWCALSNAQICISMNLHPLILASLLGISCVAISSWWKFDQFMKGSEQTRQVIPTNMDAESFSDSLKKAVLDLLSGKESERSSINRAVARLKRDASLPFEIVAGQVTDISDG